MEAAAGGAAGAAEGADEQPASRVGSTTAARVRLRIRWVMGQLCSCETGVRNLQEPEVTKNTEFRDIMTTYPWSHPVHRLFTPDTPMVGLLRP
ncbi:hypothetical protein GCM10028815_21840 [Mariniluteicoccus flavus]